MIEICNSNNYTVDLKPIIVIRKSYTIGNIKIPVELKADFTDIPEDKHLISLQLVKGLL